MFADDSAGYLISYITRNNECKTYFPNYKQPGNRLTFKYERKMNTAGYLG